MMTNPIQYRRGETNNPDEFNAVPWAFGDEEESTSWGGIGECERKLVSRKFGAMWSEGDDAYGESRSWWCAYATINGQEVPFMLEHRCWPDEDGTSGELDLRVVPDDNTGKLIDDLRRVLRLS